MIFIIYIQLLEINNRSERGILFGTKNILEINLPTFLTAPFIVNFSTSDVIISDVFFVSCISGKTTLL